MKPIFIVLIAILSMIMSSNEAISQPCNNSINYLTQTICQSAPYNFHGQIIDSFGIYYDTIPLPGGCDSILSLQLFVIPNLYSFDTFTICQGNYINYNGHIYSSSGTYIDTIFAVSGCDSIITLRLNVISHPPQITRWDTICPYTTYNFYGQTLYISGTYIDTVTAPGNGCDSVITLHLKLLDDDGPFLAYGTICTGNLYNFYGRILTTQGTYYDTLTNVHGCDSIITLDLSVGPYARVPYVAAFDCSIGSYTFRGKTYDKWGTYMDTIPSGTGCDTIFTINTGPINEYNIYIVDSICLGGFYVYRNDTLTQAGPDRISLPASDRCDTFVNIYLTYRIELDFASIIRNDSTLTAQSPPNFIFQWHLGGVLIPGATAQSYIVTQDGYYTVGITDSFGCHTQTAGYIMHNLGIEEPYKQNIAFIFPNPAHDKIQCYLSASEGTASLAIYDMLGAVKYETMLNKANTEIDLHDLAKGIYQIKLVDNRGQSDIQRIVIY